jgi:hypothetical protein
MEFKSKKLIQELNTTTRKVKATKVGEPEDVKPVYTTNKRKWTFSGVIVGLVAGIPIGIMVEIWRFITGQEWDGAFIGIVITVIAVLISTVAGYFYGAYLDGGT